MLAIKLPLRELIKRHPVSSRCLSTRLHGQRPEWCQTWREAHSLAGRQTGRGNVYIFHLCAAVNITAKALSWLGQQSLDTKGSASVVCSAAWWWVLCVCTQWAVMRSAAVQLAKWNSNKRSHFTLTAAESSWCPSVGRGKKAGFLALYPKTQHSRTQEQNSQELNNQVCESRKQR